MQNKTSPEIPDDEIDLKSIGGKIYSFFAYPLSLFFSNLITMAAFILLGIVLAIALKWMIPKSYSASFVLKPTDTKDKIYPKILNELPSLLKKEEVNALATLLNIDRSVAAKLDGITIMPSQIKNSDSTNTVEIKIDSPDTSVILPVQKSIIAYLENSPYYARIRNLQENQIAMNLEQVEKDLVQLDSLKNKQLRLYDKQHALPQTMLPLSDLMNPTAAYVTSAERMDKKTLLMAQRVFSDRFILIRNCVVPSHHAWPPRILILCLSTIPFSLLLCFIFLHYRTRRR